MGICHGDLCHHFLPVSDFDDVLGSGGGTRDRHPTARPKSASNQYPTLGKPDASSAMHKTLTLVSDILPANQPTDSWVEETISKERVSEGEAPNFYAYDEVASVAAGLVKHSFVAPLADLINFGPPCLTGSYNPEEQAFKLISTCSFEKGQEITFWYSSNCSDIMVANYGFLHPIVPPCTTEEDWKKRAESSEEKARIRKEEMWDLYRRMELLKEELSEMNSRLVSCRCKEGERKGRMTFADMAAHSEMIPKMIRKDGHSIRHEIGVRGHQHVEDNHDAEDL